MANWGQIWNLKRVKISSPAIGSDGTVYIGSGGNKLYALKSNSLGLADGPWPKFGANNKNTGRIGDVLKFGLVAHYPFDGNASDVSGSNNHGTVNGATLSADRGQNNGKAYGFE